MPDSFAIQVTDNVEDMLAVGGHVLVEPSGVGERFPSRFVGWQHRKYLLLHLPAKGPVRDHLYDGKTIVVRFMSNEGQACGFETAVQGLVFTPQRLLVVDYPKRIAVHSLREGRRIAVFLGGELTAGDAVRPCFLLNLSLTGCQIETPAADAPSQGATVGIAFLLPGLSPNTCRVSGVVARVTAHPDGQHSQSGIRFEDVPGQTREALAAYLDEAQRHLGQACCLVSGQ